jgi:S1-C subfamily serine protease
MMNEANAEYSPTSGVNGEVTLKKSERKVFVRKVGIGLVFVALVFSVFYQNYRLSFVEEEISKLMQANEGQTEALRQLENDIKGASAKVGLLERKNRSQSLFEQPKNLGEFISRIGKSVVDIYCDYDSSAGTGFSYDIETTLENFSTALITNYHVIEACWSAERKVEVRMGPDYQKVVSGVITAVDSDNDLAIVEIDPFIQPLSEATEFAKPGWWSMAIGNPYDSVFELTLNRFVSTGVIGAVYENYFNYTTSIINRGNSGGPLVNSLGQLIGINSFGSSGEADGIWNIAVDSAVLCENLIDCEP